MDKTNGKEILIVDNSKARSELVRNHLMKLGFENVSSAECPDEAMTHLKNSGSVDMIIIDQETGIELARLLKEQKGELVDNFREQTKILFTTPNPSPEVFEYADACVLLRDAECVPLRGAEDLDTLGVMVDFSLNPEGYTSFREDRETILERLEKDTTAE